MSVHSEELARVPNECLGVAGANKQTLLAAPAADLRAIALNVPHEFQEFKIGVFTSKAVCAHCGEKIKSTGKQCVAADCGLKYHNVIHGIVAMFLNAILQWLF